MQLPARAGTRPAPFRCRGRDSCAEGGRPAPPARWRGSLAAGRPCGPGPRLPPSPPPRRTSPLLGTERAARPSCRGRRAGPAPQARRPGRRAAQGSERGWARGPGLASSPRSGRTPQHARASRSRARPGRGLLAQGPVTQLRFPGPARPQPPAAHCRARRPPTSLTPRPRTSPSDALRLTGGAGPASSCFHSGLVAVRARSALGRPRGVFV